VPGSSANVVLPRPAAEADELNANIATIAASEARTVNRVILLCERKIFLHWDGSY